MYKYFKISHISKLQLYFYTINTINKLNWSNKFIQTHSLFSIANETNVFCVSFIFKFIVFHICISMSLFGFKLPKLTIAVTVATNYIYLHHTTMSYSSIVTSNNIYLHHTTSLKFSCTSHESWVYDDYTLSKAAIRCTITSATPVHNIASRSACLSIKTNSLESFFFFFILPQLEHSP